MRRLVPQRPGSILLLVVALAILLLSAGVVGARVATAPDDRIPAGVSIDGVPVGGMTREQAERAVSNRAGPATGAVVIDFPGAEGFPIRVAIARLAPIPRARIAVDEAMQRRSLGDRILRELGLGQDRDIAIDYRVAGRPLNALVSQLRERLNRPARNARVVIDESTLRLVSARDGRRVLQDPLREALTRLPRRIEVPVAPVSPAIDDAAARSARERARRMVQGPVRVVGPGGRSVVLPTRPLTRALRFIPRAPAIAVDLDQDAVEEMVGDTFAPLEREPRSARFVVEGARVRVAAGADGRRVDIETTTRALRLGRGARDVRVRLQRTEPALTTAAAREMGIRERIAEFSTPYTCCPPRVTNIRRGVEALDGTIIPAGGTFSLNDAMGER
ncbi:MAG: peptidoglycan binding domain-containing protein, partial [Miltoncostaeaceae bacterium]